MSADQHHANTTHVNAVLEPIAPSSRYDFVEIEQERIGITNPIGLVIGVISRWVRMTVAFIRRYILHIALILILLVIAEFSLRTLEPRLLNRVYDAALTGGYPIEMNALGFRGDPVAIPKPDGVRRILALGDSVTHGTGIATDETWAAHLESRLDTPDAPVEVINTGLPALDLAQIELELLTRWREMDPDQLVLMISGNMISFAIARSEREAIEPPNPKARAETRVSVDAGLKTKLKGVYNNLAIPNALLIGSEHVKHAIGLGSHRYDPDFPVGVMLAHGYVQDGEKPSRLEDAYTLVRDQISELKATADEMGITLIVAYAPPRFSLDDSVRNNLKFVDRDRLSTDPIARIGSICDELGIAFVDPSDNLRAAPSPAYVLSDYTHFASNGHDAIAKVIADEINRP